MPLKNFIKRSIYDPDAGKPKPAMPPPSEGKMTPPPASSGSKTTSRVSLLTGEMAGGVSAVRASTPAATATASDEVQVDPTLDREFQDALEGLNVPGFRELVEQYSALEEDVPDPVRRFSVAVKTVTAMLHITRDQLRDSLERLYAALGEKLSGMSAQLGEEVKETKYEMQRQLTQLGSQIGELEIHIQKAQKEKESISAQLDEHRASLEGIDQLEGTRLAQIRASYNHHAATVKGFLDRLPQKG